MPPLQSRVTDLSGVLEKDQQNQLESGLKAFEDRKGSQIAVLIIPSLEGEDIAAYGIRVAEAWKIGRKGIDDGAVLIVSMKDRRLRIEVGYGLEGVLNDAVCKRIISDVITPSFKTGDYFDGIKNGLDAMMKLIEGEPLPEVIGKSRQDSDDDGNLILPALFLFFILSQFFASALGRLAGSALMSIIAFVTLLVFGVSVLLSIIVAVLAFIVALFMRVLPSGTYGSRGYRGGGFGGGSFSSGGGFSGGGGSFGGGGASGNW